MPAPTPFKPQGSVCIVTGGASGIGLALARDLKAAGAKHVAIADLDETKLAAAGEEIGGLTFAIDVADEAAVADMVAKVEAQAGALDLFAGNAGIGSRDPDLADPSSASLADFDRSMRVNCYAHIVAAKACLPGFKDRGRGWFLFTISAAGLLSQVSSAPYSVSKHAAVGFAESLAYTVRDEGIGVSMLCPQAVETPLFRAGQDGEAKGTAAVDGILEPEDVSKSAMAGLAAGDFLILPHPQVHKYMHNKVADYNRWIGGMAKLRRASLT
ncbi:MAG: SDR family oxidoreductase [Pacificimonas sp.]|jgi:NAD(P)-dependent dehydrogenase (short-subunit alcohol dehydrogenase family)|nr:SDR family oxidoreductase [Pacificimonas sp.]